MREFNPQPEQDQLNDAAYSAQQLHQAIVDTIQERYYRPEEYDGRIMVLTLPEYSIPEPVQHILASVPKSDWVERVSLFRQLAVEEQLGGLAAGGYETSTLAFARREESRKLSEVTELRVKYFVENLGDDNPASPVTRVLEGARCTMDDFQKFQENRPPYVDLYDSIYYIGRPTLTYGFTNLHNPESALDRTIEVDADELQIVAESLRTLPPKKRP
jgi:hypothetical protein